MNAPTRLEFLQRRREGIGGSDVAAILGLSKWKTPLDVFLSKTEPIKEEASQEQSEPAYWGSTLEPLVASEYGKRKGVQIQRVNTQLKHPKHPWALANIDRAIVEPGSRVRVAEDGGTLLGSLGLVEIKTASAYVGTDWGRDGDDEAIPIYYAAQAAWYLGITSQPYCDFAVLIGGQKFAIKRQERDDEVTKSLLERCELFWFDHVQKGIPPAPVNVDDVLKLFPADSGQTIEASEEVFNAFNEAKLLRERIEQAEQELTAKKLVIQSALGDAATVAFNGVTLCTWKKAKDGAKTDWEKAARALAALYDQARSQTGQAAQSILDQYTATVQGSRRFLFVSK